MNNTPVAWINREEGSGSILDWEKDPYSETNIPLYTHPVKELTDEEIAKYVEEWQLKELKENSASTNYVQELAFVDGLTWILRKAQEK